MKSRTSCFTSRNWGGKPVSRAYLQPQCFHFGVGTNAAVLVVSHVCTQKRLAAETWCKLCCYPAATHSASPCLTRMWKQDSWTHTGPGECISLNSVIIKWGADAMLKARTLSCVVLGSSFLWCISSTKVGAHPNYSHSANMWKMLAYSFS